MMYSHILESELVLVLCGGPLGMLSSARLGNILSFVLHLEQLENESFYRYPLCLDPSIC
jgi:hypothetical protein